jgi:DNA-binding GntR family transcriptional regulator
VETEPTARAVSAHDRVLTELRRSIVSGELEAGSQHSIYQLAERFGVSRTPVREAVLKLADAGMLTVDRNRGIRIRGLSVSDIREIFDLRLLLEVPSAGFAARHSGPELVERLQAHLERMRESMTRDDHAGFAHHDRALHAEIISVSDNSRLTRQLNGLRDATQAMGASTMNQTRGLHQIELEHVPVIDAIARGDSDAASAAMREHLVETARILMRQIAAVTGEPIPEPWPLG